MRKHAYQTASYYCVSKHVPEYFLNENRELDVIKFAEATRCAKQACYQQFSRNLISPKWLQWIATHTSQPMNELMAFIK